jgi:hypothetical protein
VHCFSGPSSRKLLEEKTTKISGCMYDALDHSFHRRTTSNDTDLQIFRTSFQGTDAAAAGQVMIRRPSTFEFFILSAMQRNGSRLPRPSTAVRSLTVPSDHYAAPHRTWTSIPRAHRSTSDIRRHRPTSARDEPGNSNNPGACQPLAAAHRHTEHAELTGDSGVGGGCFLLLLPKETSERRRTSNAVRRNLRARRSLSVVCRSRSGRRTTPERSWPHRSSLVQSVQSWSIQNSSKAYHGRE